MSRQTTAVKVSAGNSGQRLTLDAQHISTMNKCFGLTLEVVKRLPFCYLQTKIELTKQSLQCRHRFVLKTCAKTSKNSAKLWKEAGIYCFHCLS